MISFLNKSERDPRRGLDKGLKDCQDRLLDVFGPLTKMFDLCEEANLQVTAVDVLEFR